MEKGSPSPCPTLPKSFAGEPVQGQRDYAVHQLRPSIFFSSICDVCASLHRGARLLSLRILMRILGVRRDGLRLFGSTSQAAGVEKLSGLRGGRGLPARAARVIHAGIGTLQPGRWLRAQEGQGDCRGMVSPSREGMGMENRGQEGIVWFPRASLRVCRLEAKMKRCRLSSPRPTGQASFLRVPHR